MAATVLGSLLVSLSLDSANFRRGTREAQTAMQRLDRFAKASLAVVSAAAVAAAGAMLKLGLDAVTAADDIYMASIRLGIGTEELSRLKYAAEQSDVTFEQLQTSLQRLGRNMYDASRGVGAGRQAFDALGISVTDTDGTLKSTTQVIQEVADKFVDMEGGAQKGALAMQLMGRGGAAMIPLLNEGAAGIAELTAEADAFGVVITQETGAAAEAFNDNLARLRGVTGALGVTIAAELLPHLLRFTNFLINNQDRIRTFTADVARLAVGTVNFISSVARNTEREINGIISAYNRLSAFDRDFSNRVVSMASGRGAMAFLPQRRETSAMTFGVSGAMQAMRDAALHVNALRTGFGGAEDAAVSLGSVGGTAISRGLGGGMADTAAQATRLQSVLDRIFPRAARERQYAEDLALVGDNASAAAALLNEYNRARGLGSPERAVIDFGIEPLVPNMEEIQDGIKGLTQRSEDGAARIAKSFREMADDTLSSLNRMTDAIRGGGFLGILEAVIGLGLQLGSMGVFGKAVKSRLNSTVPGYAGGTNFHPGGMAMVGERGPELLNLPRGSQVIPNHALGGGTQIQVIPSPYFDVRVNQNIANAAPSIASAGASGGQQKMAYANSRRWR